MQLSGTVLVLPVTQYLIVLLFFCIVHFGNGEIFFTWCNFSVMLTKQITGFCTTAVLVSICEGFPAQSVRLCHVYLVIVRLCFVCYVTVIAYSCFSSLFAVSVSWLAE